MNIHIDLALHNAFKAATAVRGENMTAVRGENMTDVLLQFIQDYVHRYGVSPKKERRK